jgi:hypothetical protein
LGPAAVTGLLVGLLSGLTGTGGGIFLSPLLIFFGWAGARQQAGITAPFILANSIAGLAGNLVSLQRLPSELPYFVAPRCSAASWERSSGSGGSRCARCSARSPSCSSSRRSSSC